MQRTESLAEKHTRLARQLIEDARQEITAGDLVQGGEKLWGATQHALRAYCASHDLPHGKYAHRPSSAWRNNSATRLCVWRSG